MVVGNASLAAAAVIATTADAKVAVSHQQHAVRQRAVLHEQLPHSDIWLFPVTVLPSSLLDFHAAHLHLHCRFTTTLIRIPRPVASITQHPLIVALVIAAARLL